MCFGTLCHGVVIGHALHLVPLAISLPTCTSCHCYYVIIPCASALPGTVWSSGMCPALTPYQCTSNEPTATAQGF